MNNCVTAILRDFSSNYNNDDKWEISGGERHRKVLRFLFYGNGNCQDNEGYVSILFSITPRIRYSVYESFSYDEIRYYLSVVDVSGNKRFTQSVVFIPPEFYNAERIIGLERYVKRETLLNDPDELLPNDCLTICVDIDRYFESKVLTLGGFNFDIGSSIQLDTDFGRELRRISEVFQSASDGPMMESRTREMCIPEDEIDTFVEIFHIFDKSEELLVSIYDICDLYRVADKYDIQPLIETCRQIVNACLCATDDPKLHEQADEIVLPILELADYYRDDDLKETLQTFLESKENFGTNYHALGNHLKEKLHTEWKCEFREDIFSPFGHVTVRRRVTEPEFLFYQ